MIKNQRQFEITRAQATEFARALDESRPVDERIHPLVRKAQRDALESQLQEMRADLDAYAALERGAVRVLELTSLADLPTALIQARIAAKITQGGLAERLGLKEQAIQRYEKTNYAGASLERIQQVMQALGVVMREEVFLPTADVSYAGLVEGIRRVGLTTDWIKRLVPTTLFAQLTNPDDEVNQPGLALRAAGLLGRVFGVRPMDLFSEAPAQLAFAGAGGVRFKLPARAEEAQLTAFTVYAHYLALLVLEATPDVARQTIPTDPQVMLDFIRERYGSVNFRSVLLCVWDLGVAVLPLQGPGAFHGACWRTNGRNVVVLKQSNRSPSRWMFDLLHEIRHAAENPDEQEFSVIEEPELADIRRTSDEEIAASQFAGDITLNGKAENLVQECVELANGQVNRLTRVVPGVAKAHNVSVGALANYLASRLSLQGINWWGAAHNLQEKDEDPWEVTRDELLRRANLDRLSDTDRNLLIHALSTEA